MNNLTFGNARHQYYETVCGGSGAGPGFAGTDAVHTHMTNSRLTDPEILEQRYPVMLEASRYAGARAARGQYRGGDGVRRVLRFDEAMELVILANRRVIPPYGMAGRRTGGAAGATGSSAAMVGSSARSDRDGVCRARRLLRARDPGRRGLRPTRLTTNDGYGHSHTVCPCSHFCPSAQSRSCLQA